jgi:hypothetical protein
MAGAIKHRFPSVVPDELVPTEVGPDEWNDSLVMSGGNDGDIAVRRAALADGWELIKLGANPTWVNLTLAQNSGTGETDLHTYSIPAGHFNVTKKGIRFTVWGDFAANANVKTLRLKFGAAPVTIVLNPTTGSPNGTAFAIEVLIYRTGANTQVIAVKGSRVGIAFEAAAIVTAGAETEANALTLKLTGQSGTASNDINLRGSMIEYLS